MSPARRGTLFFLTIATVVSVGVLGARAIRAPARPRWPGRIAVIGLQVVPADEPVAYLAVADPIRRAVVVVPPDAVVEVPGSGFLRAYHAWQLGRSSLVRATLGRLFAVDVSFSVTGRGSDFQTIVQTVVSSEIPPGRAEETRALLDQAAKGWVVQKVDGQRKEGDRGAFLVPDRQSVDAAARAIGGLGTKVLVDPTTADQTQWEPAASPAAAAAVPARIDPAQIAVDVLNGGQVAQAAGKTAAKLKAKGYVIRRVGDSPSGTRTTSVVYFKPGVEAKGRQVADDLGYGAEPLPGSLQTDADVLVLLGSDAK